MIDPPWPEKGGGKIKRGADRHYKVMSVPQIISAIDGSPLWQPNPDGCHVWCWVTNTYLFDAKLVMEALGIQYKTNLVWVKTDEHGDPEGVRMGLGQYARQQHELCLLGIVGKGYNARLPTARKTRTPILAPRGEHSEKPDEFYRRVKRLSMGPYAELFARGRPTGVRKGWKLWGYEAKKS